MAHVFGVTEQAWAGAGPGQGRPRPGHRLGQAQARAGPAPAGPDPARGFAIEMVPGLGGAAPGARTHQAHGL